MKKQIQTLIFSTALMLASASCGQINSPLAVIGTPGTIPLLNIPIQGVSGSGFFSGVLLTNSQSFVLTQSVVGVPAAAAAGVVIDNSSNSVTILHSGRLQTRIDNVGNLIVRTGDYVNAGQALSSASFLTTAINFSVILDGTQVCPWSFMTTSARSILAAVSGFGSGVCIF